VALVRDLLDELLDEVEHAVAGPYLLPKVGGGVTPLGRRHGRIAGAAELALVEGQEARLLAGEVGRHVDQVWVHREVRQASAVGEERLAGIAVPPVLA